MRDTCGMQHFFNFVLCSVICSSILSVPCMICFVYVRVMFMCVHFFDSGLCRYLMLPLELGVDIVVHSATKVLMNTER